MDDTNYWFADSCARTFWDQHKSRPYQQLLDDTTKWLDPEPGQRWLDLGCGGGQLTARLWEVGNGALAEIVAMDCAAANETMIKKLQTKLSPPPREEQIRFVCRDFSHGLPLFETDSFDGVVSGLSICYAESRDETTGEYTDEGYNRVFAELFRILKPGGRLVFSVTVPNPSFWRIFWKSLGSGFRMSKPGRLLINGLKMQSYGRWLKREASRGRFHFLPIEDIVSRLERTGFDGIEHQHSYADQAYVVAARKCVVEPKLSQRLSIQEPSFQH